MKKLFSSIFFLFIFSTISYASNIPALPPIQQGTAAELTAGTGTFGKSWSAKTLADEFAGASAEVVDEAVSTANFDGDTSHAASQDALENYFLLGDHDLDGLPDALDTDAVDAITEIAAALKAGADLTLLTGTAGTSTYTAVWNADGDLVDGYDPTTKQDVLSEGAFVDGDKTKLDGIEASADVTDATNVDAAGAIMESDFSANGLSLGAAANYAAMRALLDLEAGTDFYSISAADAAFEAIDSNDFDPDRLNGDSGDNNLVDAELIEINGATTETNIAADDLILIYDVTATANRAMTRNNFVAGIGAGQAVVFDIEDDGGNDSTDLGEIATSGDTNNIFTEPTADKMLIDLSSNWPGADLADQVTVSDDEATDDAHEVVFTTDNLTMESDGDFHYNPSTGTVTATAFSGDGSALTAIDAATGDSATGFFDAGSIEPERGGLGADVSAYAGLVAINGGSTSNITDAAGLENILSLGAYASDILGAADSDALVTLLGLVAGDIPDLSATYEVQLNNEAGLYAVLSDVSDFLQPGDAIDSSIIGGSTPAAGTFTTLTSSSTTDLGDTTVDSLTVSPVNNPYWLFDDNDMSIEFAIRSIDTTTDHLAFGTTNDAMASNFTELGYMDVDHFHYDGNVNITTGHTYQINDAQINIGNLAAGGNWTPTGTINLDSATLTLNSDALTVDDGSNYSTISGSASDDTIDELIAAIDTWASGVSAGTLLNLSDVGGSDVYTSGYILIADGDSYDPKAVGGDISIAADGTVTIAADAIDSGSYIDGSVDPVHMADADFGAFTVSLGVVSLDDDSVQAADIATDAVTMDAIDADGNFTSLTGNWSTSGYLSGMTQAVSIGNCEGAHDGAGDASTLSDSGESLTVDAYIGMTLYNITDGSSCTVTDNDATTITCTLSGGTDNDWDASDVWQVGPGPQQSGSVFYISAATTIAHPATAGYVAGYFAAAAQVITIDPYSVSMTINFSADGTFTDPGAGDEIDGDGTQGDLIWIHNASTTEAYSHGVVGTWADGGAS